MIKNINKVEREERIMVSIAEIQPIRYTQPGINVQDLTERNEIAPTKKAGG